MPHIIYTPDEGDKREWDFKPGRVKASVCELIERRADCTYEEWQARLTTGDMRARRVLLWHLLWLDHGSTLRFEDVDFHADELTVEANREELLVLRANIADAPSTPDLTDAQRAAYLAVVDREIAKLEPAAELGKAG